MKKLFTLLLISASAGYFAQNLQVLRATDSGVVTATITNGGGYTVATTAGSPSHPSALLEDKIIVKNLTASTHTYNVTRTILSQNPALVTNGDGTATPQTYFCFGQTCFGNNVSQPSSQSDYTVLGPNSVTNTAFPQTDNNQGNGELFVIYLQEGSVQGQYLVQYKLFNTADPNDTLSFKVGYNYQTVGIKSLTRAVDLVSDIYPNPAVSNSKIFFDLGKDEDLKFQVYNSLGSLVASSNMQHYSAGKNQMPVDASELTTGVYFVSISSNTATMTKRLVVTK